MGAFERQDDIGLRARRQFQFATVFANPFVAFFAHVVRHDDNRFQAQQVGNVSSANAEISGGRPQNRMFLRDLPVDQPFNQRAVSRTNFMRS